MHAIDSSCRCTSRMPPNRRQLYDDSWLVFSWFSVTSFVVSQMKTDADVLAEEHKFLRDDVSDPAALAECVWVSCFSQHCVDTCVVGCGVQLVEAPCHSVLSETTQALCVGGFVKVGGSWPNETSGRCTSCFLFVCVQFSQVQGRQSGVSVAH
jgi:hypothetical protein